MSSSLHSLSQPSTTDPLLHRTRIDPETQAQTTALRMLAARADQLRDRIGLLLQTIMQDPMGDRTRGSMYPWSTLLEWYQDVTHQAQEFSSFLQNPRITSSSSTSSTIHSTPLPNLLQTTFVQPSRHIGSTHPNPNHPSPTLNPPLLASIYHQPDPPLRSAPDLAYNSQRLSLFTLHTDYLLHTLHVPPESLGFIPDQDLFGLLHEDRTDRVPKIWDGLGREVDRVKKRLGRGKEVVRSLEGGFDWKVRLGDIYGSGSDDDDGDDDDDDDDDDEDEDNGDGQGRAEQPSRPVKPNTSIDSPMDDPEIQIIPHLPIQGQPTVPTAPTVPTTTTNPSTPSLAPPATKTPNPNPIPIQGTSSSTPINLDLSDSESETEPQPTTSKPIPHPSTLDSQPPSPNRPAGPSPTASSPLFGTDDETGTEAGVGDGEREDEGEGTRTGATLGASPMMGERSRLMDVDMDMDGTIKLNEKAGAGNDDNHDKNNNNDDDDEDEDEEMEEVDA